MRQIIIFSVLLLSIIPLGSKAQNRWELSLFGGISNYEGDLAPDPLFKESHPAFGLAIKRNSNAYFSYSFGFNSGTISGNDSNSKVLAPRGLKFTSSIFELTSQIEFNFFKFGSVNVFGAKRFTPYVFTGLSYFHFNPTTEFQGTQYNLINEKTEGQGFAPNAPTEYKLWQFGIPIGGGVKFNLSEKFNLLINAGYRATFTSYLDDVGGLYPDQSLMVSKKGDLGAYFSNPTYGSNLAVAGKQRGNPNTLDWYMFYGITLSYLIPGPICPRF